MVFLVLKMIYIKAKGQEQVLKVTSYLKEMMREKGELQFLSSFFPQWQLSLLLLFCYVFVLRKVINQTLLKTKPVV